MHEYLRIALIAVVAVIAAKLVFSAIPPLNSFASLL
jgi:hypothetical protein